MYTSYAVLRGAGLGALSPAALLLFVVFVFGFAFAFVRQLCVAVLVDFDEVCTALFFVVEDLLDVCEVEGFSVFRDFPFFIAFCCASHSFSHL
jgi:hypothetical protein